MSPMQFPFSFWKQGFGGYFVRSHGSDGYGTTGSTVVYNTVEEFNGFSWASGTSDTTSTAALPVGDTTYNGLHWVIDGKNASSVIIAYTASYDRTSWSTYATRTTNTVGASIAAYGSDLLVAKGTVSTNIAVGYTASNANLDSFNGTSWTNGLATFSSASMEAAGGSSHGFFRVVGGLTSGGAYTGVNETWNGTSTGTDTGIPFGGAEAVAQLDRNTNFLVGLITSGATYTFNGTSWTLVSDPTYMPISASNGTGAGCANGFNSSSGLSYINGGSLNSNTGLDNASAWNGTAWASVTSSSEFRSGPAGSVLA